MREREREKCNKSLSRLLYSTKAHKHLTCSLTLDRFEYSYTSSGLAPLAHCLQLSSLFYAKYCITQYMRACTDLDPEDGVYSTVRPYIDYLIQ